MIAGAGSREDPPNWGLACAKAVTPAAKKIKLLVNIFIIDSL
jgi:hypothetical protein